MRIPFISRFLEGRDRSVFKNPAAWFSYALGAVASSAGIHVSEQQAMSISTVYACVNVIAGTLSMLPLHLYQKKGVRRELADWHPLYYMLHEEINPEMEDLNFRELLTSHLLLWGNAYAEKDLDMAGRTKYLWPLRPDMTRPERDPVTRELRYIVSLPDGQVKRLPPERIFHLRGPSLDGVMGMSPIRQCMDAFGLAKAAETFGGKFFANGANVGGVIKSPTALGKEKFEKLKKDIKDAYEGLGKSHRLMILEHGLDYMKVGIPPQEAQFLETRKFQRTEICGIYRVPPHKIADLERSTNNNIEHQDMEFCRDTILPWAVRWEKALNRQILNRDDRRRGNYYTKHNLMGLLRGDSKTRGVFYRQLWNMGAMNVNEIRALEEMNPIGPEGDVFYIPLNLEPASEAMKRKHDEKKSPEGGANEGEE